MRNTFVVCGLLIALSCPILCARTILVGSTRPIKTPCDAKDSVKSGDTVLIDAGTYVDQACIWAVSNTVIRAVSQFAHLKAPAVIPNQKAILVIGGSNTVVENLEFSDASVPDQNGAGIRQEGTNVAIRNCYFHNCEDGILGGSGYVLIEYSEFANCGFGDGYSHNMYISACDSFRLQFCYTHDAKVGHTVKSRAFRNYILYNLITSDTSSTSYEINLPNAGTSFIIGNAIEQGPNSQNSTIVDYGSEGLAGHDSSLYVVNNTIVNDRGSGTFISVASTSNRPKVFDNFFVGGGALCSKPMDSSGNITTNAPAFANRSTYDYHITAASPGIDKEVNPGSASGFSMIPIFQYVNILSGEPRVVSGSALDVGAFELKASKVVERPGRPASIAPLPAVGPNLGYDLQGRSLPKAGAEARLSKVGHIQDAR